jgi:enoyl-CoA hydratase/carnithine racemase
MMQELTSALMGSGESNEPLRVIVLDSEGPVFSAGHNLKELVCKLSYTSLPSID